MVPVATAVKAGLIPFPRSRWLAPPLTGLVFLYTRVPSGALLLQLQHLKALYLLHLSITVFIVASRSVVESAAFCSFNRGWYLALALGGISYLHSRHVEDPPG